MGSIKGMPLSHLPTSLFSPLTISEDIIQGFPRFPKAVMESASIL